MDASVNALIPYSVLIRYERAQLRNQDIIQNLCDKSLIKNFNFALYFKFFLRNLSFDIT